ncbi:conserved protein of unknown function [Tenacibaculum sp. 190130A14a]|uniref:Lipoprotein n=1 Tax=Tenacibaculum polynesiense TaxID=3137857 RepID=A0ABM9PCN4_9FLAO
MNRIFTKLLFLSFIIIGCNSAKRNKLQETLIYITPKNEVVCIEIKDSSFVLNWIFFGKKKSSQINYFGIIQFNGVTIKNELKINKIVKNSIKTSNGKTIKTPIDQWPELEYNNKTKQITFYNDTLNLNSQYSIIKTKDIIDSHDNWNGNLIQLNDLR